MSSIEKLSKRYETRRREAKEKFQEKRKALLSSDCRYNELERAGALRELEAELLERLRIINRLERSETRRLVMER